MGAVARVTDRAPASRVDHLIRIIRSDFKEMPGMRLTRMQFRRLWNLGEAECEVIVQDLLGEQYLAESRDGRLCRRVDLL
jgi:hypothetical protein